jgi:hypothetical protein
MRILATKMDCRIKSGNGGSVNLDRLPAKARQS